MSTEKQLYFMRLCKGCHGIFGSYLGKETTCAICKKKTKITNGGGPLKDCPVDWDQAKEWQETVNSKKEDWEPKWGWDCGFKLDFDTCGIVSVESRFYPPKTHYGETWDGSMNISVCGKEVLKKEFDCPDLETLRKEVEAFWKHYKAIITSNFNH